MIGKASVRLRLRRSDSLALRQMPPPLPALPVLPQLPLESSSAVDADTHGNVGDGRRPRPRPDGDDEEAGASPTTSLEVFSITLGASAHRTPLFFCFFGSTTPPPARRRRRASSQKAIINAFHDRRSSLSLFGTFFLQLRHDFVPTSAARWKRSLVGSGSNLAAISLLRQALSESGGNFGLRAISLSVR